MKWDFHEAGNLLVMVLFRGGKLPGQRPDARKVGCADEGDVERMGLWQSLERALGYGAPFLRAGWVLRIFSGIRIECAQDRLAETIVVDQRKTEIAKPA